MQPGVPLRSRFWNTGMQELSPKQIKEIQEIQNDMELAGFNMTWEACVRAYLDAHAEIKRKTKAGESLLLEA